MTKSKKTTTTKASAKPAKAVKRNKANDADRKAAVAQAQAADTAANASATNPDVVPLAEAMKPTKAAKGAKAKTPKKTSGLDAAAQVLTDAGQPMRCKDMVETMLAKGLWKTDGKTPAATIYAAILREIQTKGTAARFKKTDRGLFTVNAK
jgi:hypothetical protein